jgi:hypothetical protein
MREPVGTTQAPVTTAAPPAPAVAIGASRVLALGYGFFTLAAGARSGVQLATHYSRAPLAYVLSAVAAAIYLTGMVAMLVAERRPGARVWARRLCLVELAGVVVVGVTSVALPSAFSDATVWSDFGSGYAFVPVALPLLGLLWIYSTNDRRPRRRTS